MPKLKYLRGFVLAVSLYSALDLPAQAVAADARVPVFDVVTIKPNKSDGHASIDAANGTYMAENVSLKMLARYAYGLKDAQLINMPKWGEELHYDVQAKSVEADPAALKALTNAQNLAMQQAILTDRFQLKFHHETRMLPVYELTVEKGGPKFGPSQIDGDQKGANGMRAGSLHTNNHGGSAEMISTAVSIGSLVNVLSRQVERIVVDKTGLTGKYDLNLTWTRDDSTAASSEQSAPTLFTALQEQLGLRLRPVKAPVDTLVVDHASVPAEN